jgi:hypothetical protein
VTTTGGHSTLTIHFSRHTNAALARLHRLSLTLRLIVRGVGSPATVVMSAATLGR